MQNREKTQQKKTGVEILGERVFVQSPRMLSFTHRCLTSIRHPFVPLAVGAVNTDEQPSKSKKTANLSRAERLAELLGDTSDEEKWKAVGRMLDSMMFEKDIATRRQHALENPSLRRALEMWWCKAGGTTTKGICEESYKQLHALIYKEILHVNDICMHGIITKAVSHDWQWDSEGKGEVSFGRWYVSLLEIADNWVPNCEGENYGAFLENLLQVVTPKPATATALPVKDKDAEKDEWEQKCAFLERNCRLYHSDKLIRKQWTTRHTVEYVCIPPTKRKM